MHGSNNVGSTRARSNENDTGLARGTGITLGHVTSTLFVLGKKEIEVLGVVDSIENGENGTTGVTDCTSNIRTGQLCNIKHEILTDVLHTLAKHHLVEDLSTTHSNHSLFQPVSFGVSKMSSG